MLGSDPSSRSAAPADNVANDIMRGEGIRDSAASHPATIWGPELRTLTVGLVLIVSMAAFEALAVATILPAAVNDIGGMEWYGWVFSGFMLANLVSIATAGRMADRRGVARPFMLGSGVFVIGLLGAGAAPTMAVVVACRIAQGLGAGAISSVAYVTIARGYPADARPRMLAILSSAWVVPGLIGPAVAGAVADHASWRWVFIGLAPPTVLASVLALPSLRRLGPSSAPQVAATQTPTAIQLAAGAGAALFGLGCADLRLAAVMVVAGVALALPALTQLLPPGTLRGARGLPAAVATVGLLGFAFFSAEAFLPLSLTEVRGQSSMMSGIALTAAALTWTTGAWIQARLAAGASRQRLTIVGLLLIICGVAGIAIVAMTRVPVSLAVLAWGVAGLGMGIAYSTATLVVLESAPAGGEGAASSAAQLANVLGTAVGTGVGGAILVVMAGLATSSTRAGIALVDATAIAASMLGVLAARGLPGAPPVRDR